MPSGRAERRSRRIESAVDENEFSLVCLGRDRIVELRGAARGVGGAHASELHGAQRREVRALPILEASVSEAPVLEKNRECVVAQGFDPSDVLVLSVSAVERRSTSDSSAPLMKMLLRLLRASRSPWLRVRARVLCRRTNDASIGEDVNVIGYDVVEQSLVMGNDEHRAIGRAHLVDTVRDRAQGIDVEARIGFVENAEGSVREAASEEFRCASSRRPRILH